MYKQKKAIVSLSTYTIMLSVLILILIFSFGFYETSKTQILEINTQEQVLNSVLSFRSNILESLNENTTLTYQSTLDSPNIKLKIINNKIIGEIIFKENKITQTESSLTNFCSDFEFYPTAITNFYFNGTCIKKLN